MKRSTNRYRSIAKCSTYHIRRDGMVFLKSKKPCQKNHGFFGFFGAGFFDGFFENKIHIKYRRKWKFFKFFTKKLQNFQIFLPENRIFLGL